LEYFEFVDPEDTNKRERERRKRRMCVERWENDPSRVDEHGFMKDLRLIDNPNSWATAPAQRRSLKLMSLQMDQMVPQPQQARRSSTAHRRGLGLNIAKHK
jgi:hypothetical protein